MKVFIKLALLGLVALLVVAALVWWNYSVGRIRRERESPRREHAPRNNRVTLRRLIRRKSRMAETDTDAADNSTRLDPPERWTTPPGLFRRYRSLPRNVLVISLVSFLNDASSEIIYPLLPVFLSVSLGVSPALIGLIEGGAESVSSFLKLFAGYFSDRSGRRKAPVVFGYALAGLVRPLLGFATSWPQVFAVRFADRVGKGIRSAPRDAMIADSAAPHERGLAFGFHRARITSAQFVGPLLGFGLLVISPRAQLADALRVQVELLAASVPALAAVLVARAPYARRARPDDGRESESRSRTRRHPAAEQATPPRCASIGVNAVAPRFSRAVYGNFKRFLVILAIFTWRILRSLCCARGEVGIRRHDHAASGCAARDQGAQSPSVVNLSDKLGRKTLIVSGCLYARYIGSLRSRGGAWCCSPYGIYFASSKARRSARRDLVPRITRKAYGLYISRSAHVGRVVVDGPCGVVRASVA